MQMQIMQMQQAVGLGYDGHDYLLEFLQLSKYI